MQALDSLDPRDESAWEGLLVASTENDALVGVAWLQVVAGNSAVVWLADPAADHAEYLFRAAAELVDRRGISLAQYLGAEGIQQLEPSLARGGFTRLATLAYLFAVLPSQPTDGAEMSHAAAPLWFSAHADEDLDRLAAVLEATYVESRDCPALGGVRDMSDVLAGYRAQGRFMPEHWYIVREGRRDAGALLLADHPGSGNWELIYMGVVPAARGKKYGAQILRHAIHAAACGGAERLVLAVDADNSPALAVYSDAGFREWDRRTVYTRLAARRN